MNFSQQNLKRFFKSFSSILNHPKISYSLGVNYDLLELTKNSVPEDLEFLGVVPLRTSQQEITFTSKFDTLKVRIARLILFGRKMAENKVKPSLIVYARFMIHRISFN